MISSGNQSLTTQRTSIHFVWRYDRWSAPTLVLLLVPGIHLNFPSFSAFIFNRPSVKFLSSDKVTAFFIWFYQSRILPLKGLCVLIKSLSNVGLLSECCYWMVNSTFTKFLPARITLFMISIFCDGLFTPHDGGTTLWCLLFI